MIKVNLSDAVSEKEITSYKKIVKLLAEEMENFESAGFEYLGWKDLPVTYDKKEVKEMKNEVLRLIKEGVDTLVVIGIGGSFAGAKAAIEMIQGQYKIYKEMEVIFMGKSLSSTEIAEQLTYLEEKNFAINIISKSGTTTEPAIAFRLVKKLLEEKIGENNAKRFIISTTDANNGTLIKMAKANNYKTFVIPENIGGRFSVLTPVGLFPMIAAGININEIMKGAYKAYKKYSPATLIGNDAYRYAVARTVLSKKKTVELMVQYEPQMAAFNEWWKQLAGESEGKGGKGLFPASAIFSTDLHSLGQFIQEGKKTLFETVITVNVPIQDISVIETDDNLDNLNYLSNFTMHDINTIASKATIEAHTKIGKVPNIHITIDKMDEEHFGQLVIFFERAVAMTAYLQGSNPFNQPGVEVYKHNMFQKLGKK